VENLKVLTLHCTCASCTDWAMKLVTNIKTHTILSNKILEAKNMDNYDLSEGIFDINFKFPYPTHNLCTLPTTTRDISLTNKKTLNCHFIPIQDKNFTCIDCKSCQKWTNIPCIHPRLDFSKWRWKIQVLTLATLATLVLNDLNRWVKVGCLA